MVYEDENVVIRSGAALATYKPKEEMAANGLITVEIVNGAHFFFPRTAQMAAIIRAQIRLEEARFPDRGRVKTVSHYLRAFREDRENGQAALL